MNEPPLTCSVVMVSYYTGEILFAAIRLALMQRGLQELIVVSNGNPPEHEARLTQLQTEYPQFKLISGHGNIGFAAACNLGAQHAVGGYLLLLNPDVMLAQDALYKTMRALQANSQAMLAGCHLLNPDGTTQRGCIRNLLTPQTALAEIMIVPRFFGVRRLNRHQQPLPQTAQAVPAVSGAFMMLRLSDYALLGGMDPGYFLHVEDLDLCWRVIHAGREVLFVPEVRLVHLLSTSDVPGRFIERCKTDGFKYYFARHFGDHLPSPCLSILNGLIEFRYGIRRLLQALRPLGRP